MSWETVLIRDITKNLDSKRKPLNESERNKISSRKLYPYVGANSIMGYVDEYLFDEEIICIAEDGGSWGKGEKCCIHINEKCWVNNHAHVLSYNGKADLKFLMYLFNSKDLNKYITGSTRGKLTKSALDSIEIQLPPLPIQKRIAEILDAADALKRKDQELLKKYDELAQAIFIDMFGDPVRNEKGWELVSLSYYGTFKNGLNFNSGDTGKVIKYLSVGDFKSKYKIDDIEKLTSIELNTLPNDDYLLMNGDIVFVRSNGNKALVGRCVEVFPDQTSVTFSGFCIRYRLNSKELLSSFLAQLFRNSSFKSLMLDGGRGANIQNINQGILSEIKVPKPDLVKQQHFVKIIEGLELQKIRLERQVQKSENLFNSLIQMAFNGELVA